MVVFELIAAVTLASSVAALSLRNLVHCALALAVALSGLAALYLQLGAQFVGFAQVLVYVGAVAILVVFAILLTRGSNPEAGALRATKGRGWPGWLSGLATAGTVFGLMTAIVLRSHALPRSEASVEPATVRRLGEELMTRYILPLEVLGLLLTAALIGAVIVALREPESDPETK